MFVAGVGGGGASCSGQFIFPPPTHLGIKVKYFAIFSYFKLSEHEDVSIVNMIQGKFNNFLCRIVLYAKLLGRGQAVQGILSSPHPPGYQSIFLHNNLIMIDHLPSHAKSIQNSPLKTPCQPKPYFTSGDKSTM